MSCDKTAQVQAYHDLQLPRSERGGVEAHLQECAECRDLLADLRQMSEMVASAPMAEMSPAAFARLQKSWDAVRDRGVMRIASWLTAAAAAVLVGAMLYGPADRDDSARSIGWQTAALTPPVDSRDDSGGDLVVAAQWIANDLSLDQTR